MEIQFKNFQHDVLESSFKRPIIVDFWATWCSPCKTLSPILEKLAREAAENWYLVKINVEQQQSLAAQLRIKSIPSVKMFYNGRIIAEFLGALPENAIRKWLNDNLPSEEKKLFQDALQEIKQNNIEKAKKYLAQIIKSNPDHSEARVTLAKLLLIADPGKALTLIDGIDEGHKMADAASAIRQLTSLMLQKPDMMTMQQEDKTLANLFEQGLKALSNGDLDSALNHWIEILQTDKLYLNESVKNSCAALFKLLGSDHELTAKYHRRFTSALF